MNTMNLQVKEIQRRFTELHMECFLPMRVVSKIDADGNSINEHILLIHNLIFVRGTKETIIHHKKFDKIISTTHFMVNKSRTGGLNECIVVPERQMQNFMKVCNSLNQNVKTLETSEYLLKPGTIIRIKSGDFQGVQGVIKRIKRNKHVVICVGGIATLSLGPLNSFEFEIIKK